MVGNGQHSSKVAGAVVTTIAATVLGIYGLRLHRRAGSAPSKRRRARRSLEFRRRCSQRGRSTSGADATGTGSVSDLEEIVDDIAHGLEQERELKSGAELVNELVARAWPHVSEWFGNTVRKDIGPRLRGIAQITECHLGTKPAVLFPVLGTASYLQDWPCDDWYRQNIRVEGELDYSGDGKIRVEVPSVGAHIEMSLVIRGTVVIELVKVTDQPPFCGGFRVYFPDKPEVIFRGFERPVWLDAAAHFLTGKSLDRFILDQIKQGITERAVLPRRFANGLSWNIDPVYLRHPRPQGVLRITAELCAREAAAVSDGRSWLGLRQRFQRHRLPQAASEPSQNEFVEITLGADTRHQDRWDEGKPHDFLVTEWGRQWLRVAVREDKASDAAELHAEVLLTDIVNCQGQDMQGVFGPAVYSLPLQHTDEKDAGTMRLKAEWRPFTEGAEQIGNLLSRGQSSAWHLGTPKQGTWALMVDLYHATGLPGVEEGTKHWAKISVFMEETEACPASTSSQCAARTPRDHALASLKEKFGGAAAESFARQSENIPPDAWRKLLGRAGQNATSSNAVDVVWDESFCHLLDSPCTLVDSIAKAKVVVTVCRAELRGRSRDREIGTACCRLGQLLDADFAGTVTVVSLLGLLPGLHGKARRTVTGQLKLGLQVRPLKRAPDLRSGQSRRLKLKRALPIWMVPFPFLSQVSSVQQNSMANAEHNARERKARDVMRARNPAAAQCGAPWPEVAGEVAIGVPCAPELSTCKAANSGEARLESPKKWVRWMGAQTTSDSNGCGTTDAAGGNVHTPHTPKWTRWLPWVKSESSENLAALDIAPQLDDVD